MPELNEALTLLAQVIILTVANYLLILYLTDVTIKGPGEVFELIRAWAGISALSVLDEETGEVEVEYVVDESSFWAKVLDCHRCSSPYAAAGLIVLSWLTGFVSPSLTAVILWLAVTGATVLIFELTKD